MAAPVVVPGQDGVHFPHWWEAQLFLTRERTLPLPAYAPPARRPSAKGRAARTVPYGPGLFATRSAIVSGDELCMMISQARS